MVEHWLTVEQAAALAGYHPNHIRRLIKQGKVNGRKWGQAWQVDRESLVSYLRDIEATGKKRGPKTD